MFYISKFPIKKLGADKKKIMFSLFSFLYLWFLDFDEDFTMSSKKMKWTMVDKTKISWCDLVLVYFCYWQFITVIFYFWFILYLKFNLLFTLDILNIYKFYVLIFLVVITLTLLQHILNSLNYFFFDILYVKRK